jgi:large subunit ribosomal protein L30
VRFAHISLLPVLIGCCWQRKKFFPLAVRQRPPSRASSTNELCRGIEAARKMYWKVTLMRSGIGLPKRRNDTLVALGLRKRFRTVYKPINPQIAGLLLRVKELIRLEIVDSVETRGDQREKRKAQKGYIVEQVGGMGYVSPVDLKGMQTNSSQ